MAYGVIYKITNTLNGKLYVGKTTTPLNQRMASHRCADTVIGKAIRKHGWENFNVEVLEECETPEQLNEREIFWIAELNCKTPNGYNRSDGGDGATGCSCSDEKRAKLSAANKGKKKSPEHRAKIGAGNRGKKQTPEAIAKISAARTGKITPPETKTKLSAAERHETSYKNLIVEMDKHQLTYTALAKLLGITKEAISAKMHGKKNFTAEQVAKLVEIFDRPVEYLLQREEGLPEILSEAGRYAKLSVTKRQASPYKNLLNELDARQLSYNGLAKLLDLSHQNISLKMSGKKNFTAKDSAKLVEIFDKPAEYLMARDDGLPAIMTETEKSAKSSKAHRGDSPFKNLLSEMDNHNVTYGKLAELLGLKNQTSISERIRGKTRFNEKDVAKLVEIFDKPAEYLMARDD